jgi:hypothetical protein
MPTSAKRRKRNGGGEEFFYLDDDHQKQDAEFHDPIVDDGDHASARKVSVAVMKRLGLTPKQIAALTKEK